MFLNMSFSCSLLLLPLKSGNLKKTIRGQKNRNWGANSEVSPVDWTYSSTVWSLSRCAYGTVKRWENERSKPSAMDIDKIGQKFGEVGEQFPLLLMI